MSDHKTVKSSEDAWDAQEKFENDEDSPFYKEKICKPSYVLCLANLYYAVDMIIFCSFEKRVLQ